MTRARKRFGQHWLKSDRILAQIIAAAALSEQDRVLEIGPGTGLLTQRLMQQAAAVVAVEVDRDLCRALRKQFAAAPNFALIEHDVLTLDDAAIAAPFGRPNKVVANIPYYITGPILERLLGSVAQPAQPYDSLVLLVQKEVAERICATPGTRAFGALSARLQYLACCELVCPVPAKAFSPPPKVESAVIRLTPRPFSPPVQDPQQMDWLIKQGFAAKRKMLRNNLKGIVEGDRLEQAMSAANISPQARAEALSVLQWVQLSNALA